MEEFLSSRPGTLRAHAPSYYDFTKKHRPARPSEKCEVENYRSNTFERHISSELAHRILDDIDPDLRAEFEDRGNVIVDVFGWLVEDPI